MQMAWPFVRYIIRAFVALFLISALIYIPTTGLQYSFHLRYRAHGYRHGLQRLFMMLQGGISQWQHLLVLKPFDPTYGPKH